MCACESEPLCIRLGKFQPEREASWQCRYCNCSQDKNSARFRTAFHLRKSDNCTSMKLCSPPTASELSTCVSRCIFYKRLYISHCTNSLQSAQPASRTSPMALPGRWRVRFRTLIAWDPSVTIKMAAVLVFCLWLIQPSLSLPLKKRQSSKAVRNMASELNIKSNSTVISVEKRLALARTEPASSDVSSSSSLHLTAKQPKRSKKSRKERKRGKKRGKGRRKHKRGKKRGRKNKRKPKRPTINETQIESIRRGDGNKPLEQGNSPRRQRLYSKVGVSFHLAVLRNGRVRGEKSDLRSNYTILEIRGVGKGGIVAIMGAKTRRYLCVNKRGKLNTKAKYNVKKCRFQERILPNNQNTYESLSCSGCYLNLNKRGRVKRLKKSNPNMQETHFLPRSHSETYNRSKRVAFAKRGKTVAIDIANMTTSTSVGAPTQASSTGNVQVSDSYETGTQSEPKSNTRHKRRKSTSADRVKAS